jgi:uncharacterized protein (DUF433 family)
MTETQILPPLAAPDDEPDTELVPRDDPRYGLISVDPERMGGVPCFAFYRLPIQHLWDYLESGATLDEFLDAFDGTPREQVLAVLRLAKERLLEGLPRVDWPGAAVIHGK